MDVMRKLERNSLTLTCGTDYDGFTMRSLYAGVAGFGTGFGHYDRTDRL